MAALEREQITQHCDVLWLLKNTRAAPVPLKLMVHPDGILSEAPRAVWRLNTAQLS